MGKAMTPDLVTIITMIFGGSGVAGIIVALTTRRKSRADALKVIEEAASAQVDRMRIEAETWRNECIGMRKEIAEMECKLEAVDVCQNGLRAKVIELEEKLVAVETENKMLKARIVELEKENWRLKNEQ